MATIVLEPRIPNNVVILPITQSRRVMAHYERGDLVILRDRRVQADFDFLATIVPPVALKKRRDKFTLTHPRHSHFDHRRDGVWDAFLHESFRGDSRKFDRFHSQVGLVNQQLHEIVDQLTPGHRFFNRKISWKFQHTHGENLHIDNLAGCNSTAQLRMFVNLAQAGRKWGVALHLREYARREFFSAALHECLLDAFEFNLRLTRRAFGGSNEVVDDPRHIISFEPGEIWLLNSSVTAHQIRYGTLMAVAHFEFPYSCYRSRQESLPRLIAEVGRESLGHFAFERLRLQGLLRRYSQSN